MIDVYTANTPNGLKIPMALEELGVFEPKEVDEAFEQIAETGGEE